YVDEKNNEKMKDMQDAQKDREKLEQQLLEEEQKQQKKEEKKKSKNQQ
ncbi:MAG: hypothetical protein H6Q07_1841, partial [Acidobacteria bacterium]|nr:hypothetical protein [Acidobacteriota bacterium]